MIAQSIPEVVERIQEPPGLGSALNIFTDEEFAQELATLDAAISIYLGSVKAMGDQVSSHERILAETRCKLDSQKCVKDQRRQSENDLASISNMIQCERDEMTEVKRNLSSALRQRQRLLALRCPEHGSVTA